MVWVAPARTQLFEVLCNHCGLYVQLYVRICVYGEAEDKGEQANIEIISSFSISLELYFNGLKRDFRVRRGAHTRVIYMNGSKGTEQN
jgi:cytochrome c oxidase assembly protein Cox11